VPSSTTENITYRQRQQLTDGAKRCIARAATQAVPGGRSLILNFGTTPEAISRELPCQRGLRVITNNLSVAAILSDTPDCELIVASGVVRTSDRGIVGEATLDFIRQFKVDIALIGISGIEAEGTLPADDYRKVKVARAILGHSLPCEPSGRTRRARPNAMDPGAKRSRRPGRGEPSNRRAGAVARQA
jgi:DeoR family glycerol-3-phosphate regulon repressor